MECFQKCFTTVENGPEAFDRSLLLLLLLLALIGLYLFL